MTILVTGARGNIGSRVIATLTEAGHDVRGSAREAHPDTVQLDITNPTNAAEALRDVDTMFLYPTRGTVDEFLAAARDATVRHVVLLSSPAAYEPGEYDRPIGMAHRAMEQALERSGLSHTVLYPSWLATNALRDWAVQIRGGRLGIAYPDAQVSPIHLDDIADVATNLLTRERHRGRMVVLTGPESLRLLDVVGILADVLGRPIPVDTLTREQVLAQRTMPEPVVEVLLEVAAAAVGVLAPVNNTVERITGHPARPFREWAQDNRAAFDTD
jgi:uncharacterized protein YbjT (DUF2867 family)